MTSKTPSDLAGEQIKKWRLERGMTAEQLAARCAELGAPEITSAVIANIETGRRDRATGRRRRTLTLEELCLFAEALDVPPVRLMVPLDGRTRLQVTPTVEMSTWRALFWVSGENDPADPDRRARWREAIGDLYSFRNLRDIISAANKAQGRGDTKGYEAQLKEAAKLIEWGMLAHNVTPPALPAEVIETMKTRGWLERADEVPVRAKDDD
ncbi:helix-turn-helix domain-containing protein [Actinomadura sp. 9N215]|uniref:helix-turn-helix domain-containing protein n=1 Tax=Actinomadura sp. 9N215 TaxID=3375150 RepID=UPI0037913C8B